MSTASACRGSTRGLTSERLSSRPQYNRGLMKILIGGDHAGFELKQHILAKLRAEGKDVTDAGAHEFDASDDYPDFALAVSEAVARGEADRGIVICGSGVGAGIAANKVRGIRASMVQDTYSAAQGVEHDDMNVICLGGRVTGTALAEAIVDAFLQARFTGEQRHQRRLNKVLDAEARF